ncbi:MAG: hypothetical protein H0W61_01610 [Bacteroidetes bacterium]|nr:hypothetical protein [Bacteroidota bacterium]
MFTFLTAMVFTVARYIPLEEDLVVKTELSKKSSGEGNEEGDTEDGDPDTDNDLNDFLNAPEILDWTDYNIDPYLYNYTSHKYLCFYVNITTPPPKI